MKLWNPFADLIVAVANVCEEFPNDLVPHINGFQFCDRERGPTEEFVRSLTKRLAFVGKTYCKRLMTKGNENERERDEEQSERELNT